jgi:(R,R)-butanediol dehydrogenase/meso-butanediol dehydrogenase/diacetyl reductase
MKALLARGPKDFTIGDVPEPKPGREEVLLKPLYAGVCFTDKHGYEGTPNSPIPAGGASRILGHEWSGEVVELGEDVKTLKKGDRVVAGPAKGCGECLSCRSGLSTCSAGVRRGFGSGDAELSVLHESACYKVPPEVSDLQAGFVEPMAVGTRSARLSGVTVGDNVVFLGAEDYGLSMFQWVRLYAGKILVADPSPARRKMVESLGGATEIIDPNVTDPVQRAKDLMPWGADVVVVASEGYVPRSRQYMREAILIARPGGTIVTARHQGSEELSAPIGIFPGPSAFIKELKLLGFGTYFGTEPIHGGRERGDYAITIDGCASGKICGKGWKPTVIPFADLKTKKDIDDMFAGIPDRYPKVLLKIAGN